MPKTIVTDKGSSLANLVKRPDLISQLTEQDIEIVPIGQAKQSSNFVERQIRETKRILSSMKEDSNSSNHQNSHAQEELQAKLYCVESILNSRPILTSTRSAQVQILTPKMLQARIELATFSVLG